MSLDPWGLIAGGSATSILSNDLNYSKILAAKKALKLLGDNSDMLVKLCIACSESDNYLLQKLLSSPESQDLINNVDKQGFTPLIYAICFDSKDCVDILLNLKVDPNMHDQLIGYTPLMWATYLERQPIVEALLSVDADPYLKGTKTKQSAVDLIKPGSQLYDFYKSHNYLNKPTAYSSLSNDSSNTFYKEEIINDKEQEDSFKAHLNLQTMSALNSLSIDDEDKEIKTRTTKFVDDEIYNDNDTYFTNENFDFNQVLTNQFIKFNDGTISSTIDYIFELYKTYSNKSIYPASIVYQCLRYADNKIQSPEIVESFLTLFLTRVRSITGTKSGVVQLTTSTNNGSNVLQVDIVVVGYWISCLNHLYYFLYRDGACQFFKKYPKILQEIISTLQPLICQLSFSLDSKLENLIEPCILDYNSVPDSNTVYKADWKIFKSKVTTKSTYEDIISMLYPPSLEAQMKPSPLKVIQTMGALLYVLELYHINDVIKQQCFATVLYWLGTSLFNRILANKKYSSRSKALQIRLNLSFIQDWLRANNLTPFKPDQDNKEDFPDSIIDSQTILKNVARFNKNDKDPMDSAFYYNSLYKIGQIHLMPVFELLEWLQIMTGLHSDNDIDLLKAIIDRFDTLNAQQLLNVVKNYRYEVEEHKFSKVLKKYLKENVSSDTKRQKLFYISTDKLFLSPTQVFPLTLPNITELLHQYGADFNKVDTKKLKIYQPHLPIQIVDVLEEIYDQDISSSSNQIDNEDEIEDEENIERSNEGGHGHNPHDYTYNAFADDSNAVNEDSVGGNKNESGNFAGSELFKELSMPSSVAHKTWDVAGTDESTANPWA